MGRLFGTTSRSGGRLFGGSKSGGVNEDVLRAAEAQGYTPKPKTGFLTRAGNVLSAFEPGGEIATLLRTGDVGKAGKQYVSEVGRGLGSAIPALDPITKPRELAEERQGYGDVLKELGVPEGGDINLFGNKVGTVRGAAGLVGDIALDPGNILLSGIFKTIGKTAGIGGKATARVLSKTPKGQKALGIAKETKDLLGSVFNKGYMAKKSSPEAVEMMNKLQRTTNLGTEEAVEVVQKLITKHGLENFNRVPGEIETLGSKSPQLSEAAKDVVDLMKNINEKELSLSLRKTSIEDYFPRKVVGKGGVAPGKMQTSLGGAEKQRTFATMEEGKAAGIEYLDPPQALASRLATSQKATETKGAINQIVAGYIKDVNGESILRPLANAATSHDTVPEPLAAVQ